MTAKKLRNLVVICGDQLDHDSAALDGFDPERDAIVMTEAAEEATYVWQSKRRIALFFAAMRHFRDAQRKAGRTVLYTALDDEKPPESLAGGLKTAVAQHDPERVVMGQPGDWRVQEALEGAAGETGVPLTILEDRHFFATIDDFEEFSDGRKRFIMEDFYRMMRKRTGLLMQDDKPSGGAWNYDKDNRKAFGKNGPGLIAPRAHYQPDPVTLDVLRLVEKRFADAPGTLEDFGEPVTREDALHALDDFIANRLRDFGTHQDAMWDDSSTLNHSRISAVINLKLIDPREVCDAAIAAYEAGAAPLNAVEGFVRQILGWREWVRGLYWTRMPEYAGLNALEADRDIPDFFWTGETDMACLRDMLTRLLRTGYAHHIERLMGMGLYLMMVGARPYAAHDWHMGLYLDAIDWVSLPNMLGMSQHGDGGIVGTKPYCASGAYIDRMSNYCSGCRFDPKQSTGERACPFTTLYWDFLARHEERFSGNRRMALQMKNLHRKDADELRTIRAQAEKLCEN